MDKDIEFLKNIKFRDVEDVYRTQQIIDRLTTAGYKQTLEELAIWVRGALECPSWRWDSDQWEAASQSVKAAEKLLGNTIPGPVPQLATGLQPGDKCRVKDSMDEKWYEGSYSCWKFCEPIPHLKKLSEIIRMAESGECGKLTEDGIEVDGRLTGFRILADLCDKPFTKCILAPDAWLEER